MSPSRRSLVLLVFTFINSSPLSALFFYSEIFTLFIILLMGLRIFLQVITSLSVVELFFIVNINLIETVQEKQDNWEGKKGWE